VQDKIFFTYTSNGIFSLKKAYQLLSFPANFTDDPQHRQYKILWEGLWKIKGVIPRVKLFVWRALRNAIPVAAHIATRIHTVMHHVRLMELPEKQLCMSCLGVILLGGSG
jgi:zinc-binding in reverse transcriptase